MKTNPPNPMFALCLLAVAITGPGWASALANQSIRTSQSPPVEALHLEAGKSLDTNPKGFIPNVGQVPDATTKFVLRDRGVSAYFTDRGFILWTGRTATESRDGMKFEVPVAPRWQVLGARPVEPVGGDALDHTVSYFRGQDPAQWRANVPAFGSLRYPAILEGTELRVESREHGFEYTFHLEPHAKPDLRFRYEGITGLEASPAGDLMVRTATGHFTESRPVAFQWIDGERRAVESSFEIVSTNEYRIGVGAYDARYALVIDPVLDWSMSVGGSYQDQISVIKVDPSGNLVVAGPSFSVNLPTTSGFAPFGTDAGENFGADPQFPEHTDVYVAKFSADGMQLLWAGYLGGEGAHPESTGRNKPLAMDAAGDVYITTHTQSPDFPVLPAGSSAPQGGTDAAITKIKADGSEILWSRLLGGPAEDHGYAVAIHETDLYLSGVTTSPNFPVTARTFGGLQDAFIARLNAADGTVVWSSFLGGSMEERISALAADASGVIVFGDTDSADFHAPDFPAPAGHDRSLGGGNDAFITRLDSTGNILWSTYLGGNGAETTALVPIQGFSLTWGLSDMSLDSAGNLIAAGHTYSTDFPNTIGRFQPNLMGTMDGYVAKLAPDGSQVLWSTYLGGTGPHDRIVSVALNPWDEILVGGGTSSLDFPTTANALKPTMQADGFQDGFMAKLDRDGQSLLYSTYLGNDGWHDAALALTYGFGRVLVGGWHFDTFSEITAGAFGQECDNCGSEMFLMSFLDAFLAHDGFESGNYSGGQGDWSGNWTASGDISILTSSGPHSGNRHVRLRSSSGYLKRTVTLPAAVTSVTLGFWSKINSFESSDRANVLVSLNGANWTTVGQFTPAHSDNQYHYYELDLTGFLPASQLHVAFDAAMNANNDYWYLDDVRFTGSSAPVPPTANAGPDQTVTDTDNSGAEVVVLNGTGSFDPDGGGIVAYEWTKGTDILGTSASINPSLDVGVHTITLTVTDDENTTASDTVQVTVNATPPPPANPLHIGDLDRSSANSGKNWKATVVVTAHNGNHGLVPGATVSVQWSGGASGTASAVTDANGRCSFTSVAINKSSSTATLTITGMTHPTLTYSSGANHDPDGESNGTSIMINKP